MKNSQDIRKLAKAQKQKEKFDEKLKMMKSKFLSDLKYCTMGTKVRIRSHSVNNPNLLLNSLIFETSNSKNHKQSSKRF